MADKERDSGRGEGSGLDMLRDELTDFLGAQVEHLVDKAGEKLGDVTDQLLDTAENGGSGGSLLGIGGRILQGDSPLKAFVGEKAKGLKDNVMDKVKNVFGGGRGGKSGSTKVMNIIEVLDVGVPIRVAYNYWTQYEEFSDFTKGVRSVSRNDETASDWKVKVGPSTRGWKATVQEQVPDERIVWSSEGAKGTTHGCVSFHELTPDLTRIVLVVEYYPSGFFEKTGNLWRAQGRRLRLDFKNFQRYVTFADEDVEGWRGEIRDGEVVRSHEEVLEEEEAAGEDEEQEEYDEEAPDEEAPEEDEEEEEYDEEGPEDEYAEEEGEDDEDEG
ncbi:MULTISPECIES: SRPBCC family protein [Streptomyces]|uniref:SRPBCC family protein n=1 Tax=Streptomyces TaxID=1883 RepID=UPI001164F22E|nr:MULTISPECIES: SRPBCC family protein [Streptomyces]MCX4615395.1 SRPBCC family protein [Streptomyces mirabilis]MCX5356725.1 SRPBCC family protein [Streptomyces mirabilis]QDN84771.1 SRPBCC family protein [Streptomyces sp. RLB3-6]QDO05639.1 SRPBCC family protein [Streptomyces sp. S1D4-23]